MISPNAKSRFKKSPKKQPIEVENIIATRSYFTTQQTELKILEPSEYHRNTAIRSSRSSGGRDTLCKSLSKRSLIGIDSKNNINRSQD